MMKNCFINVGVFGNVYIKIGMLCDVCVIVGYVVGVDGQSYIVVSFINNDYVEVVCVVYDMLFEWIYVGVY